MNGKVRLALGLVGGGLGLVVLAAAGGFMWVSSASTARMNMHFESHRVDIPLPYPLSEEELGELRTARVAALAADGAPVAAEADPLEGVDLDALAMERAVERGKHLVEARYACVECHGEHFGGGTMIDDPLVGTLFGPNLTTGTGSRTLNYTMADWDRLVRHGILPDGRGTTMPSVDFFAMSDQELSDLVAYIRSLPPVDKEVPPIALGPLGKVLMATGVILVPAELLPDHQAAHVPVPPKPSDTLAFGKHLAQVCTGCHGADFVGGPVPGGPPDWPPAANLTSAALGDWDYERFEKTMRTGVKADGSKLQAPMDGNIPFAQKMTDEEMRAMFEFLKSVPPGKSKG